MTLLRFKLDDGQQEDGLENRMTNASDVTWESLASVRC